jgi:hypothetical protein
MRPIFRLVAVCFLVPSFFSAQEAPTPVSQAPDSPSAPPAAAKQPEAKPQEQPKFYQPEGPDPTQTIADEHSVTDMLDVVPFTSPDISQHAHAARFPAR